MERRLFLTGLFGMAAVAATTSLVRPVGAMASAAGAGNGAGILDELDSPIDELGGEAAIEPVHDRYWRRDNRYHRRHWRRHHRRHRRRVYRRFCRRYWHRGRRRVRCYWRRVWRHYW